MTGHESQERHFKGFSRRAFQFLKDLKTHNDKAWFDAIMEAKQPKPA